MTSDLRFAEFRGETFDVLLAQSVFTHLLPEHIEECFAHVGTVMHASSSFYFTYAEAPEFTQTRVEGFRYPASFFIEVAKRHGFELTDHSADYPHPRHQKIASVQTES